MNCTLLTELFDIFKSSLPDEKQTIYHFFDDYVLSSMKDKFVQEFYINFTQPIFSRYFSDNKSYSRPLSQNILAAFHRCPSWKLPPSPDDLQEHLQALYQKFLPDCSFPNSNTEAFSNLIRFSCTGDYYCYEPDLHFPVCSFARYFAKSNEFIGRVPELTEISDFLKEKGKFCLSGPTGIGKTFLIKKWLYINKNSYTDIAYIKYSASFEKSLESLTLEYTDKSFDIKLLKQMSPHALLVIDDMNGTAETLRTDLNEILALQFHVIIITRNPKLMSDDNTLFLDALSQKDLKAFLPDAKINQQDFQELLNTVNSNTLMLSLISKAWAKQNYDESFIKSIINIKKPIAPKFKMQYDGSELTYQGHIKYILDSFPEINLAKEDEFLSLNFMSCIPNIELRKDFFLTLTKTDITWYNTMVELSIFTESDSMFFSMPQLIADALYFKANFSFKNYRSYINFLSDILSRQINGLQTYDWNMSVFLHAFIIRFSPYIKESHNTNQKTLSSEQMVWRNFIYQSIQYMQSMNETDLAYNLLEALSDTSSELLANNIYLPTQSQQLYNSWIVGNTTDIETRIESMANYLTTSSSETRMTYFNSLTESLHFLSGITLDAIILDFVRRNQYTTYPSISTIYKNVFLTLTTSSFTEDKYTYYHYINDALSADSVFKLTNIIIQFACFIKCCSNLSIIIQGTSFIVQSYSRIIDNALTNHCPTTLINSAKNGLADIMDFLFSTLKNKHLHLLPQLDFHFLFWAYVYYYLIFSSDKYVVSSANSNIEALIKLAPYLTDEECATIKSTFAETVFESKNKPLW